MKCPFCDEKYRWSRSTAAGCGPCLRKNAKPIPMKCSICGHDSEGMYCTFHIDEMRNAARKRGDRSHAEITTRNKSKKFRDSRTTSDKVHLDG